MLMQTGKMILLRKDSVDENNRYFKAGADVAVI